MPDTVRGRGALATLFADNTTRAIEPQDQRDFLASAILRNTESSPADYDAMVAALPEDLGLSALAFQDPGEVAITGGTITGLLNPTGSSDAANKAYVDNVVNGLRTKEPVRAATTANITVGPSVGTPTIDGVALANGDRILAKDQSTAAENGIYTYLSAAGGSLTRSTDMDTWTEVPSATCWVMEGSTNADTVWVCTSNASGGTIDVTSMSWTKYYGAGIYQASHANLTAFAGLSLVADRLPYANGTGTLALATFTAAARTFTALADPNQDSVPIWDDTTGAYVFMRLGLYDYIKNVIGVEPLEYVDLEDASTYKTSYGLLFDGNQTSHLSCADHSDFDFSSSQKFTIIVIRNPRFYTYTNTQGIDSPLITQWDPDNGGSSSSAFYFGHGSSTGQGNSVRLSMATNASGSTSASVVTPNDDANNSPGTSCWMMACTYDGTQGTAADRARLYRDGVYIDKSTYVASGTLPASPQNSTAPIRIGIAGKGAWAAHKSKDAIFTTVVIKGVTWTDQQITDFAAAANGMPLSHNAAVNNPDIDLTGCVLYLHNDEQTGSRRYDHSGQLHHFREVLNSDFSTAGSVTRGEFVHELTSKGKNGKTYTPKTAPNSTDRSYQGKCIGGAPLLVSNMNGHKGLSTTGYHFLYALDGSSITATAAEVFQVRRIDTFLGDSSGETFEWSFNGEVDDTKYYIFGRAVRDGHCVGWCRIRNEDTTSDGGAAGPGTGSVDGAIALEGGGIKVSNWRVKGTGGAASYEHRVNGVDDTLTYNAGVPANMQNTSFDTVKPRDNTSIFALVRRGSAQVGPAVTTVGLMMVLPAITQQQNRDIESRLRAMYGT